MKSQNQLAVFVLAAAKAHEESYDKTASDAAVAEVEKHGEAVSSVLSRHIDFSQFQKLNIFQATCTVVPVDYQMPVYLLLQTAWNDALDWANAQVAQTEGANYAFDLTFKPEGEQAVCVTHQVHADSELAAAFKIGQIFDDQFGADFCIERNTTTYEFVETPEAQA
jgi:hypothetical protein